MKHIVTAIALAALAIASADANAIKYRKATSYTDEVSNLPGIPKEEVKSAMMRVQGADIRWRDDGDDPTHTFGMLYKDGDIVCYTGDVHAFRFIAIGKYEGSIDINYMAGDNCASR